MMNNTSPRGKDPQGTKGGLWVWAFTVSAYVAIGQAISADSWGRRAALVGGFGFAVMTLVTRGIAAICIRANPEAELTWRAGISRGWRWFTVFGTGVVSGLIQTIGGHHPWRTAAIRVMVLAAIWTALYFGVKVLKRDTVDENESDPSEVGNE
jgi:hypothetical protein